jgi:DNA-binding NtrC family response regulator
MMEIAQHSDWDLALADSREHAAELIGRHRFTIIVCDRDLPGLDWRDSMQALVTAAPGSCILLASSVSDDYLWQEVIQRGGYDVLTKPFKDDTVAHSINQAAWYRATRAAQ